MFIKEDRMIYIVKGRLQHSTDVWPAVSFGCERLSLFKTLATAPNRRSTSGWVLKSSLSLCVQTVKVNVQSKSYITLSCFTIYIRHETHLTHTVHAKEHALLVIVIVCGHIISDVVGPYMLYIPCTRCTCMCEEKHCI